MCNHTLKHTKEPLHRVERGPEKNLTSQNRTPPQWANTPHLFPESTPMLWQNENKSTQRKSTHHLFHLIDFECTTWPAPSIHGVSYMPPRNQISIWCQGGWRFGVISPVNTTCQFSLCFTLCVTLAQAWNGILRRSKPPRQAHPSLPTWQAGATNLRSPKSGGGVVMRKTPGRQRSFDFILPDVTAISVSCKVCYFTTLQLLVMFVSLYVWLGLVILWLLPLLSFNNMFCIILQFYCDLFLAQ